MRREPCRRVSVQVLSQEAIVPAPAYLSCAGLFSGPHRLPEVTFGSLPRTALGIEIWGSARACIFLRDSRRPLPTRVGHTNQHVVFRRRIRVQCSDRVRVLIDI